MLNKAMVFKINEFKLRCTNKERGCKWVGELGALKDHLESDNCCRYHTALPTFWVALPTFWGSNRSCGEVMERRHLTHHQKNECLYRQYTCQHCGYIDTYDAIAGSGRIRNRDSKIRCGRNHYSQCIEYPLDCPNECGTENIKRKDIKIHRETCPMEPLDCPFQHVGCSAGKILRKDMDTHCQKMTQGHLVLMVRSHQDLAQKNKELGRNHEELSRKVDQLTKKVEVMKKK